MLKTPIPLDESERLTQLESLALMDTPAEERFDRIVRIARRLFAARSVAVTLVGETRAWFKASVGFEIPQIAREYAPASIVVSTGERVIVRDAVADPRFAGNPLVHGATAIRFYAGVPLMAGEGSVVGALEIFDVEPRALTAEELEALDDLAALIEGELRATPRGASRMSQTAASRIDSLTRLWNRDAVLEILEREMAYAADAKTPLAVLLADVDGLREVNGQLGHTAGDTVLREVARHIRASVRPYDSVGRVGGEEFLVVVPGADAEVALRAAERIRLSIASKGTSPSVTISLGAVAVQPGQTTAELQLLTERALHSAKAAGGNQTRLGLP
jgi:diguanylate cyclase (GGDEF)-like protein